MDTTESSPPDTDSKSLGPNSHTVPDKDSSDSDSSPKLILQHLEEHIKSSISENPLVPAFSLLLRYVSV